MEEVNLGAKKQAGMITRAATRAAMVSKRAVRLARETTSSSEEVNLGAKKPSGQGWYSVGRYLYVPCAIILCCVALFLKVAF